MLNQLLSVLILTLFASVNISAENSIDINTTEEQLVLPVETATPDEAIAPEEQEENPDALAECPCRRRGNPDEEKKQSEQLLAGCSCKGKKKNNGNSLQLTTLIACDCDDSEVNEEEEV